MTLKTVFLHPPSFDGFDGGAGARYQAKREVRSFWFPTWLAEPSAPAVDFVCREEFDYTCLEVSQGKPFGEIAGLCYRAADGKVIHTPARAPIEDMDALPWVAPVYKRNLKIENYFIGYLKHPYVSFYTGRGCKSRCTFCLWPQTVGGHRYRVG